MVVEELARMLCVDALMDISRPDEHPAQDTSLVSCKSPGAADSYGHVEHHRDKLWLCVLAVCTCTVGELYVFTVQMYG